MITKELLKQEIESLDESYFELIYKILHQFPHIKDIDGETIVNATSLFTNISQDPVVGMWADREDMQDSSAWVKELRSSQWKKHL
ncbi:MAG: hypothetical protein KAI79_15530 [Bacteroidales bacterium]|nr:hypothetical protein [Bacteroidales bacterium]